MIAHGLDQITASDATAGFVIVAIGLRANYSEERSSAADRWGLFLPATVIVLWNGRSAIPMWIQRRLGKRRQPAVDVETATDER